MYQIIRKLWRFILGDNSLSTRSLSLKYGAVTVIENIDLDVEQGEVMVILGRNGVGKSSLARAITGRAPSSGDIDAFGVSCLNLGAAARARSGIAYVPQGREIFPFLTVKENLETGFAGLPKSERFVPDQVFELFPVLKEMLGRRGGDLSGGQQQQLAIGRAMVMRPKLLVLDEPTEGIQPSVIKDIGRAISVLREQGDMAIILIEQYFDFAWELADSIHVMDRGAFILSGKKVDLDIEHVRNLITV